MSDGTDVGGRPGGMRSESILTPTLQFAVQLMPTAVLDSCRLSYFLAVPAPLLPKALVYF